MNVVRAEQALSDLADMIERGEPFDRKEAVRLIREGVVQWQRWWEAWHESRDEIEQMEPELTRLRELVAAMGMMFDVAQRAAHAEIEPAEALHIARDIAPFKNLFATMYGLDPIGAPLPKRRRKAK